MIAQTSGQPEQEQSSLATESLNPATIAKIKNLAKNDLYFFAKAILGYDWLVPHIHGPLCRLLMDKTKNRKKITLPRGWLKSTVVTISYPIWCAINDPNIRVLLLQNTSTNACKKLASIRSHFEDNDLFRALFPELLPDNNCIWKKDAIQVKRSKSHPEATFEAAGTRNKVVSRHYDLIIEDDTVAPDLDDLTADNVIPSKNDIETAIGTHRLVYPLLTDFKKEVIVVGTRWFELDLLSWMTENEPYYASIERACRESIDAETGESRSDPEGKITYPERFDSDVLEQLAIAMGPYLFSCLFMNKPVRSCDMMFKQDWIQYYSTAPQNLMIYTTVDPAGDPSETKTNPDFNVVMTCGKHIYTGHIYVLEYFRERCNPGDLIHAIFKHVRKYKPIKVAIEAIQYQKALQYFVRERMRKENLYFSVEGLHYSKRSKEARITGLQPVFGAKLISIREHHHQLESELLSFPLGRNDDIIDALSMQTGLWALTRTLTESEDNDTKDDPFNVTAIIKEIEKEKSGLNERPGSSRGLLSRVPNTYVSPLIFGD
ncbi:hypothetical protein LCGC14_1239900 [marine sediment metagenome]|uniref:Terminase large subunit gp17-like C-terminal domain-containing protein n=1 Tax=marine sediment metagenome TaxID=412755 RepID=A0A0F9PAB8_9ZZZZ